MSSILFSPHNDDEALFAFFTMLRHKPRLVVVLRSMRQWIEQGGPMYMVRERETFMVTRLVPCTYVQWPYPDSNPPWDEIAVAIREEVEQPEIDCVIAPAWEEGGHEDHNAVAHIVNELDYPNVLRYMTYRRGHGRSEGSFEVGYSDEEYALKEQALACYESQIAHPPTAPWFPGGAYHDMREWLE